MIPLIRIDESGIYSLDGAAPDKIACVYLDGQPVPLDRIAYVENGIDVFDAKLDSVVSIILK